MSNRILIFSETVLYFQCRACVTGNNLHGATTAYNRTDRAIRFRELRNFTEFYSHILFNEHRKNPFVEILCYVKVGDLYVLVFM